MLQSSIANKRGRVLVFGDDMRIFLTVVRSLGRAGHEVHAVPFNWLSSALKSRYIKSTHRIPRYSDGAEEWCRAVEELLSQNAFDLVIPCCDDRSILPFHIHRERFARHRIALPPGEAMNSLFDKADTRRLAIELQIPVVSGRVVSETDTAQSLVAEFGLPVVIKPRRSFWIDKLDTWGKVWIAESNQEVEIALRNVDDRSRYVVEAFFSGEGIGVSVLADDGQIKHAFQHRRLREGRGGCSSFRISEKLHPDLLEACKKFCERTRHTGVCMFEFRKNPLNSKWILIETNARFWGSSPLPVALGVNFPTFLYDLLVEGRNHEAIDYRVGVRSRNVVLDARNLIANLVANGIGNRASALRDIADFCLMPFYLMTGRERSDSIVLDDPLPAVQEILDIVKNIRNNRFRQSQNELNRRATDRIAAS